MTDLLELAAGLPSLRIPEGATLIEEGDVGRRLLVLESGSTTIERDGTPFARVDAPGSVFGELSVVLGKPATATVRAASDVTVRVAEDAEAFLTEHPGAALEVLRTTAARLDALTQYLVDVKAQFAGQEGHLGMVGDILDTLIHHQAPAPRTGSRRDPEGDHLH